LASRGSKGRLGLDDGSPRGYGQAVAAHVGETVGDSQSGTMARRAVWQQCGARERGGAVAIGQVGRFAV
jgi:hypothetical protein